MSSATDSRIEPIAERRFTVVGQPERHVSLVIGKPYPDSDPSGDWICPMQLRGMAENEPVLEVHGIDAIQALMLALEIARIELSKSTMSLTWEAEQWSGDVGIPRYVPHFYGRDLAERFGQLLDAEIEHFDDAAQARTTHHNGKPEDG